MSRLSLLFACALMGCPVLARPAWGIAPDGPLVVELDGPLDSIRWEVFAESLEDYAMLQTAGIRPDDPLLAPLKSYADFPRTREWIDAAVARVLSSRP